MEKRIGDRVTWHPHGQVGSKPLCADVVGIHGDGILDLVVLAPEGVSWPKRAVHHHSDEYLESHYENRVHNGGWSDIGEFESVEEEKKRDQAEKRLADAKRIIDELDPVPVDEMPDEIEMRVIKELRTVGDVPGRGAVVAKNLGEGWNFQRVNAVARRFPNLLDGHLPDDLLEPAALRE